MANYILFDDLTDELRLVEPHHFKQYTDYGYDPELGQPLPDTTPVTEYHVSFLVSSVDLFTQIRSKLLTQYNEYRASGTVSRLPITVSSDKVLGEYDGTHQVFWVLEQDWYTRLGSEEFVVELHGYGEPSPQGTSGIVEGQAFSVVENASTGQVIGTVLGASTDLVMSGRPDLPIAYDATTGTLSVDGVLDYETTDEYSLDIGGTEVVVYVLDQVENPLPERTEYTFYIEPDANPGSQLGTIEVQQQGDSGIVPQFSIVSGNTNSNFAIDQVTGELIVLSLKGIASGHVVGVNYGVIGETISCTIQLLDGEGSIQLPDLRFNLIPNPANGTVIGTFTDPTLEYQVSAYEVEVNASKQLVVIDGKGITEGVVEYPVSVSNPATGATGEFTAYVNVYDPSKLTSYLEFWLAVDSSNGSSVGQVEFEGVDSEALSLVFALDTPGTPFGINTQTGELLVTQASLLAPGEYNLTVSANTQAYTRSVRVVVFDVAQQSDVEFTVGGSATVGVVVGQLGSGVVYPVTVTGGSLGTYSLDLNTGVVTVGTTPPTNTSFEVTDTNGDITSVQVTVDDGTGGGDTDYLGDVFSGQSGQSIATLSNIRYSVGSVGFGQGSLQVTPDNSRHSRTIAGSVVVNRGTTWSLGVNAEVTAAMINVLRDMWSSDPVNTQYTVSVDGTDWLAYLVSFQESHSDTITVQMTLLT